MSIPDVTIRRAEPDDCVAIHAIFTSAKVVAGTLQLPYPSVESWRRRLAESDEGVYSLVALHAEQVVGMLGLHTFPGRPRRRHVGTIGMSVHERWHGKGIGSALLRAGIDLADNWLNLQRLELEVYTDNLAAVRLYESSGFEREGTLRDYAFRDGRFVDAFMMARLRRTPLPD